MNNSYTEAQIELFNSLSIGDVVWAKMPLSDEELDKIEPDHRIRPYLVVWKDFANIYAYSSSSKKSDCLCNYETYGINKAKYGITKYSWIELNTIFVVPICNLIKKMYSLEINDLNMIEKRLQIQLTRGKVLKQTFGVQINFCEGDVISDGSNMYYVYNNDNNNTYCYPLTKRLLEDSKCFSMVKINRKTHYICFDDQIVFTNTSKLKILDIASVKEIVAINYLRKNYSSKKQNIQKQENKTGCIFLSKEGFTLCLYKVKNMYYGINLSSYHDKPKFIPIGNNKFIGICDKAIIKEIVVFLYYNMEKKPKAFREMYRLLK